jgi:uncharacterized protein YbjT (DUF2867 family)
VKAIIFGATGMVGQSVLRECLLDPEITAVISIGRSSTKQRSPKLRQLMLTNLLDLGPIESELRGFDACFYCLGVTSVGMEEAEYRRITYDLALAAGKTLARLNPGMTFIFISGTGADSTEKGRVMWARVKGAAENALMALPFRAVYVIRPAVILPRHGITSRTRAYRLGYILLRPLFPLLRVLLPRHVTTTEELGRAMIRIAREGAPKRILETADLATVLTAGRG